MDKTPDTPATTGTNHRKRTDLIFIGLFLGLIVCMPIVHLENYFRQERIAAKIRSLGGFVGYQSTPESLPSDTIRCVCLVMANVNAKTVTDLGSLNGLERMSLTSTQVTDADLKHLQRLTNLKELYLNYTQTTEAGRSELRKSLPNCRIYPVP